MFCSHRRVTYINNIHNTIGFLVSCGAAVNIIVCRVCIVLYYTVTYKQFEIGRRCAGYSSRFFTTTADGFKFAKTNWKQKIRKFWVSLQTFDKMAGVFAVNSYRPWVFSFQAIEWIENEVRIKSNKNLYFVLCVYLQSRGVSYSFQNWSQQSCSKCLQYINLAFTIRRRLQADFYRVFFLFHTLRPFNLTRSLRV